MSRYHLYQRRRGPAPSAERNRNPSSHRASTMSAIHHRTWTANPTPKRIRASSRIAMMSSTASSFRLTRSLCPCCGNQTLSGSGPGTAWVRCPESPGGNEMVSELLEAAGDGGDGRSEPGIERMREAARVAAAQAEESGGLGQLGRPISRRGAFAFTKTPAGPWLLVLVAIGLVLFGCCSWAESRWRMV